MPDPIVVALTGGGTAGHVSPHLALLPLLKSRGHSFFYIGSNGIEKEMITAVGVEFHQITTGKLRRYFSIQNLIDVFKVTLGICQAFFILRKKNPSVVFSKGGFVSVPVAVAARLLGIPVVSHESDLTPGLATKIIEKFAKKILYSFPETKKYFPNGRAELVGTPIRAELFAGVRDRGLALCGFEVSDNSPVILVSGGTQGAQKINETLKIILPDLLKRYRVIHLTGRGKSIEFTDPRYKSFEFVSKELPDIYACSSFVIGRAGANFIFEFLSLRLPMLLIPLEVGSRGDQVYNAEAFERQGWANVLREADISSVKITSAIDALVAGREAFLAAQSKYDGKFAAEKILDILEGIAEKSD